MTLIDLANPSRFLSLAGRILPWLAALTVLVLAVGLYQSATAPDDYTLSLSAMLPAATGYRFVVSGNVTGTLGGSYGGVLAAAPVPEPETWAMLLAGLGLVGFSARRRMRGVAA